MAMTMTFSFKELGYAPMASDTNGMVIWKNLERHLFHDFQTGFVVA
jgi:hypothetical protein